MLTFQDAEVLRTRLNNLFDGAETVPISLVSATTETVDGHEVYTFGMEHDDAPEGIFFRLEPNHSSGGTLCTVDAELASGELVHHELGANLLLDPSNDTDLVWFAFAFKELLKYFVAEFARKRYYREVQFEAVEAVCPNLSLESQEGELWPHRAIMSQHYLSRQGYIVWFMLSCTQTGTLGTVTISTPGNEMIGGVSFETKTNFINPEKFTGQVAAKTFDLGLELARQNVPEKFVLDF